MAVDYNIPDTLYLPVENFPRLPKIPQTADEIVITLAVGKKYRVVNTETYAFVRSFGSFGSGNGQLSTPMGIAYDFVNDKVLVANTSNDRIEVFNLDGTYSSNFGSTGTGNGQFDSPQGMETYENSNGDNYLVVGDRDNDRYQIFDLDNSYAYVSQASYTRPTALSHSSNNNAIVLAYEKDSSDYYITFINDTTGSVIKTLTVENSEIGDVAFDKNNNELWATVRYNASSYGGSSTSSLLRYSYSDLSLSYREDVSSDINGEYHGISIAKDSTLFLTRPQINRIERRLYNSDFTAPVLAVFGSGGTDDGEFVMPRGCVQVNDSLYILDTNNHRVVEYSASNFFNSVVFTLAEDGTAKFAGDIIEADLGEI